MENLTLDSFKPSKKAVLELAEKCKGLEIKGVDDKGGYALVHAKRMDLKNTRVAITKTGKDLRQGAIDFQKSVIAQEKELIAIIEPVEKDLEAKEKAIDLEIEKNKRRELLPARKEKLKAIDVEISDDDILSMDDRQFDSFYNEKNAFYLAEKQRKIDEENVRIEAEKNRIQEEKEKAEAEKQRQIELAAAKEQGKQEALAEIKTQDTEDDDMEIQKIDEEVKVEKADHGEDDYNRNIKVIAREILEATNAEIDQDKKLKAIVNILIKYRHEL